MTIRIGTRGSALARAQAADVARRLQAHGYASETIVLSTAGDRNVEQRFTDVGAFGVFVRDIELALLEHRVDLAVHSYKDLPSAGPEGLVIASVPERVDPADVLLIHPRAHDPSAPVLPVRMVATLGTSAARRRALMLDARADLRVDLLRGNVPTRIAAVAEGRFDAIVIAAAGVERLERLPEHSSLVPAGVVRVRLDPAVFVPAPSQGAIALQVRADDLSTTTAARAINDARTTLALEAERALLALAESGCSQPFGAWGTAQADGALRLIAALGGEQEPLRRCEATGVDPRAVAELAWRRLAPAGIA